MNNNIIHIDECPVCGCKSIYMFEISADYLNTYETFPLFRCFDCGFILTQDFPPEDRIEKYYASNKYVSHNSARGLFGLAYNTVRSLMQVSKARLIKRYTSPAARRLLDIGCGQGHFLRKMQSKGFEVFGIEKSEKMRSHVKQKWNVEVRMLNSLPKTAEKSLDVITLWHVLEHIEKLNETMEQIHRLLADDGVLVVALPNVSSYDAKHYNINWAGYDMPRHLWHFSPQNFKMFAEKHGFEVVKQKTMPFDVFYISILSEKNKGSKYSVFSGLWFGLKAFVRTLFNRNLASSIIYVLKKKE